MVNAALTFPPIVWRSNAPECAVRPARSGPGGPGGEVELWRKLREQGGVDAVDFDLRASGPLWPSSDWAAIEVWTEAELCGLHGLWRAMRMAGEQGAAIRRRLGAAVAWHLEHTQPDNATNRPWAVHVFLLHGPEGTMGREGRADARLYAETLVHNAQAQGNADPASLWILADAARELEWVLQATGA